jgi:hypothetical protein
MHQTGLPTWNKQVYHRMQFAGAFHAMNSSKSFLINHSSVFLFFLAIRVASIKVISDGARLTLA